METTAVRVALRIRPLSEKERIADSHPTITYVKDEPQIFLGNSRPFTFDHVFSPQAAQEELFSTSITPLLDYFLDGNNATVLAYGQTGSGKTYSMGTSLDSFPESDTQGIIQRFTKLLFERLEHRRNYQLYVSFLELYNEEIIDLLSQKKDDTHPSIREDSQGQIYWSGVREIPVQRADELLSHAQKGSICRSTGSTDMNISSSRSHAIFSITLKQTITDESVSNTAKRLISKFHFVDLAGSERLRRVNALGDRQKETISINTGLLALGNVISALGDESRRSSHIPYRDSKLTRLLQDSLGGNSRTLMLACVSPYSSDYMETLNTLKYANRARNIQNRVQVNLDHEGSQEELAYLRNQMAKLKMQLFTLQRQQQQDEQLKQQKLKRQDSTHNIPEDHHSMISELTQLKAYADSVVSDLVEAQSERDALRLRNNNSDSSEQIEMDALASNYLQQIQDLKFEMAEANHRLETHQQLLLNLHHHQFEPSVSMALPGPFGSNNPTHRRSNRFVLSATTSLDKMIRAGSLSSGGTYNGRRFVRQRKRSLPVGQRMRTTRKHSSTMMNQSTLPELDEQWRFLDDVEHIQHYHHLHHHTENLANESQSINETQNDKNCSGVSNSSPSFSSTMDILDQPPLLPSAKLDISTGIPLNMTTTLLPDSPVSANTLCHDSVLPDDDDVQVLAVPAWTDEPKTQSVTDSTKRESLSWTDSLLDDSDNSIATSRLSSSYWSTTNHGKKHTGRRRSKDLLKMLHQVQADLLVKKELVGQLEKSEDEYTQMRMNYEDQLRSLQKHLVDMRYQRDYAIGDIEINLMKNINKGQENNGIDDEKEDQELPVTLPKIKTQRQQKQLQQATLPPAPSPLPVPSQRRQPDALSRQVKEIRLQYEGKIKRLSAENQEWKRKYTQATTSMTTARTKAEQVFTKLRNNIDQIKLEKKQLQRTMKQDNDRLRDQLAAAEQDIQQLKRKEMSHLEARKKWEDTNEEQQILLKKRNDHVLQVNQQMRQISLVLRKAATEGTFLNEVTLERLLSRASAMPISHQQQQ